MRCDDALNPLNRHFKVSTHAPAGGATPGRIKWQAQPSVSTHAPARGATCCGFTTKLKQNVSTHAPARGATPHSKYPWSGCQVSTHAPARGATAGESLTDILTKFQPTHLREVRPTKKFLLAVTLAVSTHAPARGATLLCFRKTAQFICFNPRTCGRCDRWLQYL